MMNLSRVNVMQPNDTLTTFLCHAVAANRAEQKTIVLVAPDYVQLQPAFYGDLADCWGNLCLGLSLGEQARLRVDWCCQESSGLRLNSLSNRLKIGATQRELKRRGRHEAVKVTRCLLVGRAGSEESPYVLGVASDQIRLPEWATAVPLQAPVAA